LALGGEEEGRRRSERGNRGFVKAGGEMKSRENKVQRGCIQQPRVGVGAWQRTEFPEDRDGADRNDREGRQRECPRDAAPDSIDN
jgi:hypothetical protein